MFVSASHPRAPRRSDSLRPRCSLGPLFWVGAPVSKRLRCSPGSVDGARTHATENPFTSPKSCVTLAPPLGFSPRASNQNQPCPAPQRGFFFPLNAFATLHRTL